MLTFWGLFRVLCKRERETGVVLLYLFFFLLFDDVFDLVLVHTCAVVLFGHCFCKEGVTSFAPSTLASSANGGNGGTMTFAGTFLPPPCEQGTAVAVGSCASVLTISSSVDFVCVVSAVLGHSLSIECLHALGYTPYFMHSHKLAPTFE